MAIGVALGFASAATSIVGGLLGSSAAKKAARRARKIARLNEAAFFRQAIDIEFRGKESVRRSYYAASQLKGAQLAAMSAAGLNADFGSAAQVRAQVARDTAFDAATIRENTRRASTEAIHSAKIARLGGEAAASRFEGQGIAALISGFSQGAATAHSAFRRATG